MAHTNFPPATDLFTGIIRRGGPRDEVTKMATGLGVDFAATLSREEPRAGETQSANALDPHIALEEPTKCSDPFSKPRKNRDFCSKLTAGITAVPFPATSTFLANVLTPDRGTLAPEPESLWKAPCSRQKQGGRGPCPEQENLLKISSQKKQIAK